MPFVKASDGADIFYREDDFTDPWRTDVETVVMLHGFCRNSLFWYAWIPTLARHFRVIRWDARGVGQSTKPEKGFPWTLDRYRKDLVELLDKLDIDRAFFVGESFGGMSLPYIAGAHPERVKAFAVCASHLAIKNTVGKDMAAGEKDMATAVKRAPTIQDYIRATEDGRLAPDEVSPAMRDWYREAWAATPRQTWEEWSSVLVPQVDLTPDIFRRIQAPVLYIAASNSTRASMDEARAWTRDIPNARIAVVQTKSQAVAMVRADECAELARDFFMEHGVGKGPALSATATMSAGPSAVGLR